MPTYIIVILIWHDLAHLKEENPELIQSGIKIEVAKIEVLPQIRVYSLGDENEK